MIRTIVYSALAGIVVGALCCFGVDELRIHKVKAEYAASAAKLDAQYATKQAQAALSLKKATDAYRTQEHVLQSQADAQAAAWTKERKQLNDQIANLHSQLAAGRLRLTANVDWVSDSGNTRVNSGTLTSTALGAYGTGHYELSTGTAADLSDLIGKAEVTASKLNRLQVYVKGLSCGTSEADK